MHILEMKVVQAALGLAQSQGRPTEGVGMGIVVQIEHEIEKVMENSRVAEEVQL